MRTSTWWLVGGIVSVIGGVVALVYPAAASLLTAQLVAILFILAGIFKLFTVSSYPTTGGKIWAVLWALLELCVGTSLMVNPLSGVLSLTLTVGLMILASGIARAVFAFALPGSTKVMILLSGLISVLLGYLILSQFPGSAVFVLGTLLGVELISTGFAQITASRFFKRIEPAT